ncbi:MAG: hypothetical protein AAF632_25200 [Bacteroidota bacterium]
MEDTITAKPPVVTEVPQQVYDEVLSLGVTHLLPPLKQWISEERTFVQQARQLAEQFFQATLANSDAQARATLNQQYSQQSLQLLQNRYEQPEAPSLDSRFAGYQEALKEYLAQLPTVERREQTEERFLVQEGDGRPIPVIKFGKRQVRRITNWPLSVQNRVRRWRKKDPKPLAPWQYDVPLRNLTSYYFQDTLVITLLPLVEEAYRVVTKVSRILWQAQSQLYQAAHQQLLGLEEAELLTEESWKTFQTEYDLAEWQLKNYTKTLPQSFKSVFAFQQTCFEQDYERAGTLELPAYRFRDARLRQLQGEHRATFLKKTQGWATTLFALHDDWRLDQELNLVKDVLWQDYLSYLEKQRAALHEDIFPQTDQVSKIIHDSLEEVEGATDDELKRVLRQERKNIDQQVINELIPRVTSVIHQQVFFTTLAQFKEVSEQSVSQIADQRGLVASDAYDQPLKTSDIAYVSPGQLAEYEMLPRFKASLSSLQQQTRQRVNDLQKLVQEIGQISYFSLDSAISVYGQSDTQEQPQQVATEGMKRALTNAERLHEQLLGLVQFQESELLKAIEDFSGRLTELKDNHVVLQLKLRLARARATERTKTMRRQTLRYIRLAVPRSVRFITRMYQEGAERIGFYRKQIGIEAGGEVTTEISDFLAETEAAVNRLPYVYQRLFSVKPLNDSVFYRDRPEVMARLNQAFENWKRGRYATTMLVGQKGSGLTTLTRFFLDNLPRDERREYTILSTDIQKRIYTESQFLAFFQEQLSPPKPFSKLEDIVTFLCQLETKHILIIEHLDWFYLRKVGGFQCLKWMLELISRTHRQVFWLMSCTQYAWSYLNKATQVADHFEYVIQLEAAQAGIVREIILKRHRVSGYDVLYHPAESDQNNKKFLKMDEVERQEYLENEYFQDLSRITQGNFAIALLYWLRSAQEVTDNQITIGSLKSLDYSFLKSLSVTQISSLHALLLHDGLTMAHFSELSGRRDTTLDSDSPVSINLRMVQLLDDGLLVKSDEVYQIHPLLYQQVVSLLQTRNFVH